MSWDVLRVASEIEDDVGRADSRVDAFDEFTAAILARFLVHFSCAFRSEQRGRMPKERPDMHYVSSWWWPGLI